MTTSKKLNIAYVSDTSGVKKGVSDISKANETLAKKLQTVGKSMSDAGKTMMTHFTAPIVAGFGVAIHLAQSNDVANRLLARSFEGTGLAGADALKNITDWSGKLSEQIGVSEIDLKTMEGRVVSMGHTFFSALGPNAAQADVQHLTLGMENLSAASGKSISMLMRSLGPSILSQPAAAVTALNKYGVLTEAQVKRVQHLVAVGKTNAATQLEINAVYAKNAGAAAKAATPTAKLKAILEHLGITIGNLLMPVFIKLAGWLGTAVDWIERLSPGTQKMVVTALALLAALGPLVFVTGKFTSGIGSLIEGIGKVVGFFMIDATAAGADAAAKGVATAATMTLNTAMLASIAVYGAIIIAVIAVAALIIKNWSSIKAFLIAAWNSIKSVALTVWNAISNVVMTVIRAIWAFVRPAIQLFVDLFKVQFKILLFIVALAFLAIKGVIVTAWHVIWAFIGPAIKALVALWKVQWKVLSTVIKVIWSAIVAALRVAWGVIKALATAAWNAIKFAIWNPIKALAGLLKTVWNGIASVWRGIWNNIKGIVLGVWGAIVGGVKGAVNEVIAAINWIIDQINKVQIHIHIDPPGPGSINFDWNGLNVGHISPLATGTRSALAGLALVGEQGPELVALPGGSQVLPAGATRQALGGAGGGQPVIVQHFHIAGSVLAERELLDLVQRQAVRNARRNGGRSGLVT